MSKPPKLLEAMRWVCEHGDGEERSQLECACRQYFIDDFKGFMAKMADLERAYQAVLARTPAEKKTAATAEAVKDEGTQQVADLLGEDWARVQRYFAAEDAKGKQGISLVDSASGDSEPA